jgi:5-methylcytosine-specific restriction endonuclease McrA
MRRIVVEFTLRCADCEQEVRLDRKPRTPFCGDLCRERSSLVRYERRLRIRLAEEPGFKIDEDIAYALMIRRAHVLSGGYGHDKHKIPPEIRAKVIARDGGRCVKCGAPGQEIDHISGPDPDLANLQLLCTPCHRSKTDKNLVPISADDPKDEHLRQMQRDIMARIDSVEPLKVCDAPEWATTWREELANRMTVGLHH